MCVMEKLLKYLNALAKDDRLRFVTSCGTTEGYLRKAASVGQKIGADLCINIERESDRSVRCEDMRPDIDWQYLRSTTESTAL
jgi:DNA-binding transcriptional regulator YdaS (Cro superfamily)